MAQIFPKWTNEAPRALVLGLPVFGLFSACGVWYFFSPSFTDVGYRPRQPVPYSHKLHVGELKMDCRYCHASVEIAAHASLPPTETCMNCHNMVSRKSEKLAPIRDSMESGEPMRWIRVHKLPDYAYFNHSAHIVAGIGCSSCHGDVAQMEEITQAKPLSMSWCLSCHRNPTPHIRPADEITNTSWTPPEDQNDFARQIIAERQIAPSTDCSACHR